MFRIMFFLLIVVSNLSCTKGCSALYGQCGGVEWRGATECCSGSTCVFQNDWYSQCLPSSAGSQSVSSTTSPTKQPSARDVCGALYGQCGGIDWKGTTQCCSESKCTYVNEWYSQCLPSNHETPSTSSAQTSPTTQSTLDTDRKSGVTTRYWDCCKASCGWSGKASVSSPVKTCDRDGITKVDVNAQSGCNGGNGYMCSNQQPWSVSSTLSYGYAAAYISGQSESTWCCACYSLIFTSGPVANKEMIVQVTNTGGDLGENHFDIQMPGGGVGLFDGCSSQFPQTNKTSWGDQYGGIRQRSQCDDLPKSLQAGCFWRFDWYQNADNPKMKFKQVPCPAALTANTECIRN